MGKHVPLPSDPVERATEKKRRFKIYKREWKRRARARERQEQAERYIQRRRLLQGCLRAHVDLCGPIEDWTNRQLREALEFISKL